MKNTKQNTNEIPVLYVDWNEPLEAEYNAKYDAKNKVDDDYKLYVHYDSNNVPFYVGCGKANRYKDKHNRSKVWNKVASNGWTTEILEDYLDRDFALMLETAYINSFGRRDLDQGTLVNQSDGGLGSGKNRKMSDEHRQALSNGHTVHRKEVLDENTNRQYRSIKEACNELELNYNHVVKMMNGTRTNTTTLRLL
jgi:hypothetical protein